MMKGKHLFANRMQTNTQTTKQRQNHISVNLDKETFGKTNSKDPDPLSDSVLQSDRLLLEINGANHRNCSSYCYEFLPSHTTKSDSGPERRFLATFFVQLPSKTDFEILVCTVFRCRLLLLSWLLNET